MNENEKREKVIKGLRWALDNMVDPFNDFRFAGYDGSIVMLNEPIIKDAIDLLEALDVTPEELERLKKCRHECKIDCLLEHYDSIKAERDALIEAREPTKPRLVAVEPLPHYLECGKCGTRIFDGDKFCRICGREVRWG